jgi:hypothetical protein
VNSRNRLMLGLGFVAAMVAVGAGGPSPDRATGRARTALRVQSAMRVDTLQLADSVRGAVNTAGGGWLVLVVEAESPSLDSELLGEVTLTGGGLPRPFDVQAFSHEPTVRRRTLFYRVVPDRGGGFITESGHVHWVVTRAGHARLEVYGRAVFGIAFENTPTDGPFQLRLGTMTAEVVLPAMIGAR